MGNRLEGERCSDPEAGQRRRVTNVHATQEGRLGDSVQGLNLES